MNTERLEEIRTRVEAATEGPWIRCTGAGRGECRCNIIWGPHAAIAETVHQKSEGYAGEDMLVSQKQAHLNGELIAHAPTDLRDCLSEIERLHQELRERDGMIAVLTSQIPVEEPAAPYFTINGWGTDTASEAPNAKQ